MSNSCKVSGKWILAGLSFLLLLLLTLQIKASHKKLNYFLYSLTEYSDTTPVAKPVKINRDTTRPSITIDTSRRASDTTRRGKDTTITTEFTIDTLKISKDSLDAPVSYSAADSGVLIIPTKEFLLYGKAHTAYKDITLDAGNINFSQTSQTVMAYGARDTGNNPLDKPTLVQGESKTISDTIWYNLKTGKGLSKNTYYNEGEIYVNTNTMKRLVEDGQEVVYAYRTTFTTCNLDTPHFAFRTKKMKMVTNKLAVSGPAHPEFEGVPIPVYLPFGIYPLNRGRHSGFLAPSFAANEDFGLGLENGGYYKVFNDNLDVTIRGNIYSYGGWNVNVNPRYLKRYRYNGSFSFSYQHTKLLNRFATAKEEFTIANTFSLAWSHTRDPKAKPGTTFSANVSAGSPTYNRYIPNNPYQNFINQLTSSITWTKTTDKTNLSIGANHTQNNETRLINLNIPTVNFSVLTLYPFQQKERVGSEKWYEKLGISYNGTVQTQSSFYDSAFSLHRLLDTTQWGIQHNIPITLSLPSLGPITLSPSISYEERWVGQKVLMKWNNTTKRIDTTMQRGFYTPRQFQVGISASTRIFGTYNFPQSNGVKAIRHEIRPTFGLNYKPDLAKQYFYDLQVDTSGKRFIRQSEFAGSLFGGYGEGRFGGITYGIDNLLEMKVRDKKADSSNVTKKIRLIDGFGFNGSYNLVTDSFQWSPVNLYLRSVLFEKINITASANMDLYDVDSLGFRTKQLMATAGRFRPGRVTDGSIAISTSLQSKNGKKASDQNAPADEFVTPDQQMQMLDYIRNNPAEFVDFNIPWSVNFSYSLSFYNVYDPERYRFRTITNSTVTVNGDFSLTPKWKVGGNTFFDFKTGNLEQLSLFISRDMHCWQMAINLIPIGRWKSFSITLNPKSGLLRDLKVNRSRQFFSQ